MVVRLSPRQAAAMLLPDPTPRARIPKHGDTEYKEQLFDASRIWDHEGIDADTENLHQSFVNQNKSNYLAIERALTDAKQQLHHLTYDCNIAAWGVHDWKITNAPSRTQLPSIQGMLDQARHLHPNWANKARRAMVARHKAKMFAEALEVARGLAFRECQARGDASTEAEMRALFEAQERDAKEARFQEWRASQ